MRKFFKIKTMMLAMSVAAAMTMASSTLYAAGEPTTLDGDVVEYDMKTGIMNAKGHVLMTQGDLKVTGNKADYNTKTKFGTATGNVIAVQRDTRVLADKATINEKNLLVAEGNVHGSQADKNFAGPRAEYFSETDYVIMPKGGSISSADGTVTADKVEGWLKNDYYKGTGHAHLVSPSNNLEAGGNTIDYYGEKEGKAILTGNAWAVQDNNRVNSKRLVVYMDNSGKAAAKPAEE